MDPLRTALRPLVLLSKALGLQTFTVVNRWWLQLVLVLCMALLLSPQLMRPSNADLEDIVFKLLIYVDMGLYPLCHLNSFLGHSRVQHVLTGLQNISAEQMAQFSKIVSIQLLAISCILSGWHVIAILFKGSPLLDSLPTLILELTCAVSELEFLTIVLLLRIHFYNINKHLLSHSIAQEHLQLLDLVMQTNDIYGCQILANISICFCTVVAAVFYAVNNHVDKLPEILLWVSPYVVRPFWICYVCFSCTKEAGRTAALVHKLIIMTDDSIVRNQLQMFSLQLLHRKVQFSAYGFFPLDFTLLHTIVGAVTTYVVFLIQFEISLDEH